MSRKQFPVLNVEMPLDVRKHVIKYQAEQKIKKGVSQYSLQMTIYTIIREHEKLIKKNEL
jgi:hypothetical protein